MSQKKIVITGGGGLIGSHLSTQILAAGHECTSVVRPGSRSGRDAGDGPATGLNQVELDLDRSGAVAESDLPDNCDAVIYLAQSNGYRNLPYEADSVFQVNVVSAAAMLEYARQAGARHFVYASTGSVYRMAAGPLTESSALIDDGRGRNLYPWSKLSGEAVVNSYCDELHPVVLRFFFVYGKGANAGMLIPRTVDRVRTGEPITLQGEQGCVLVPTHADDAAAACLSSLDLQGAAVINVAGSEEVSLRRLAEDAGALVGRDPVFETKDEIPPEFRVDISRMRTDLGVDPVDFSTRLKQTFAPAD